MTQVYWLDKILYKNAIADWLRPAPGLGIMKFVGSVINERREKLTNGKATEPEEKGKPKDFLTRFVEIKEGNPDVPPW